MEKANIFVKQSQELRQKDSRAGIRAGQETMLSSKENVVFCNVFLSKISAKILLRGFGKPS